ncbi:MFS transporter [Patescibacteria group bacterium]|nr:MFS transporter [Patescibacteria group bacterium]
MDTFVTTVAPNRTPPISFSIIYLLSVVFTFHTLVTAYSSSTYLEQFVGKSGVGLLYAIASGLSVLLFLYLSPLLRRLGNTALSLMFMSTAVVSLVLLGLGIYPAIAFIVFITLNPLLYLSLDIYSENTIGEDEGQTGSKRGLTLSLMAIASVFAPLAAGAITTQFGNNLALPYFLAAFIGGFFMVIILLAFRGFKDPEYPVLSPLSVIRSFRTYRNIRGVISAHFLLQFFFSWIVIYFPLYLATELNVSWSTLGIIIAAGLMAYVLCEYPIGILADRYWGEKEMMAAGFLILALSSASIGFMAAVGTIGWMVVMFVSRVGASLVEVTTESYFFKQVKSGDASLISLFRITRPLANLAGAVAGSVTLLFFPYPLMFILLGVLMIPGIILAAYIVDTK